MTVFLGIETKSWRFGVGDTGTGKSRQTTEPEYGRLIPHSAESHPPPSSGASFSLSKSSILPSFIFFASQTSMSLQGLMSGAECAVPFNPLSQVLKHTEGDRSIQQDRIAGPSTSRHLPSSSIAPGSDRDLALAKQFFDNNGQGNSANPNFAITRHIPSLMNSSSPGPDLMAAWTESQKTFMPGPVYNAPQQNSRSAWSGEFGSGMQAMRPNQSVQHDLTQQPSTFHQPSYMANRMYGGMPGMPMNMYMNSTPSFAPATADKGKGKSREIDFEAAFAEVAQSLGPSEAETARIVELDDTADLEKAIAGASLEDVVDTHAPPMSTDFKSVWDQLQNSDMPPPSEDIAKWESEFNQLMNSQRGDLDFDYGTAMQDAWENGLGQWGEPPSSTGVSFDDEGLPVLGPYTFEKENRHLDPSTSTQSPLADAKRLLEQNGSLTEAALLLEAAIQKGELGSGGYESWILLGEVRSMDEREEQGMRALMEGVKRAEDAGDAGEGMLSLAISFTNESYERASHSMLLRWLHARFPNHPIPTDVWESLKQTAWHSHDRVTEIFINLARDQHAQGDLDPEVQVGLGVLFYTNNEYDRAKDCFEAALSVRPADFMLWNRLGSSLSNGNHPEEALGAYREALQLRPTYTRAIYNVGVACLNIGAHKEAAEHFLSALAMQDTSAGPKSEQLWFTLRRAFQAMNRQDLADKAIASINLDVFRNEGYDF
ncbi:Peroxisomal membrane signal receptor PTS1 [Steccherinum ochraceum]|uniref:Peroxisomal membrane signal receptor PTS1 n=1 Tax=Steccherinum ochraceum TaxID=92696 RepID=A0A4R0R943_9APHY|nr:Peroxisomal membrane signal receptor PTS1 [Steccherinum ochraceum]